VKKIGAALLLMGLAAWTAHGQQQLRQIAADRMDFSALDTDVIMGESFKLTGEAVVRLYSDDASAGSMRIHAHTINATLAADADFQPEFVTMDRDVVVEHPDVTVTASHGEWSFTSGEVRFTGSPVMTFTNGMIVKGEVISLDLQKGSFNIKKSIGTGLPTGSATRNPFRLTQEAITDWPAFIAALQAQSKGDAPSPGKQIVVHIANEQVRRGLANLPADREPMGDLKKTIIKQLNGVLEADTLYSKDAWAGITLDASTTALLGKGALSADEVLELNRRLLSAAYPRAIAKAEAGT
jgi:lipopolysaccharide export system protein LptA